MKLRKKEPVVRANSTNGVSVDLSHPDVKALKTSEAITKWGAFNHLPESAKNESIQWLLKKNGEVAVSTPEAEEENENN